MVTELPIVRDYMDKKVPTVGPRTEILEAIEYLLKKRVTGAPVVDDAGNMIGMLTEKDCLKLIATGAEGNVPRGLVSEFMTTEVTTISPDMDVYYVAGLFLNYEFRRFPVVEDGRLVGAITRFDILRVMRTYMRRPHSVPVRSSKNDGV
jgi:CBS domain-containing protein